MRLAFVGNVAQNAYLLAQLLRRLDPSVEADAFDTGSGNPMWLPWWELAQFDVETGGTYPDHVDWQALADKHDCPRPAWAKILGADGAEPWYDTQAAFQADFARYYCAMRHYGLPGEHPDRRRAVLRDLLALGRLAPEAQERCADDLREYPSCRAILALARTYDLTVLMGPHAAYGVLFPPEVPYATFEHSTMRHAPLGDSDERRLLALSYRHADANILTNADCAEAAWALGLDRLGDDRMAWLPHPVDTDRFVPPATAEEREAAAVQRAAILHANPGTEDCALIFWQPARQAAPGASGGKRNDRAFFAFRRYLEEAEPAGAPKALLMLSYWGLEAKESAALLEYTGLKDSGRVVWAACASKPRMVGMYRAVDVVLDQFDWSVGSFGTTTVEAMACGKPVVTHLDPDVHDWCLRSGALGALPPVVQARTAEDIYRRLVQLAHAPRLREAMGASGRRWVERQHGWQDVAARHLALYRRVLARHRATVAPAEAKAEAEAEAVEVAA